MIIFVGMLLGLMIFCLIVFVNNNSYLLIKRVIGMKIWCFGFIKDFVIWGVINLIKLIFFVMEIVVVVSVMVVINKYLCFFLILILMLIVIGLFNVKMFNWFVL